MIVINQEKSFLDNLECENKQSLAGKYFSLRWNSMSEDEMSLYDQLYFADSYGKVSCEK